MSKHRLTKRGINPGPERYFTAYGQLVGAENETYLDRRIEVGDLWEDWDE